MDRFVTTVLRDCPGCPNPLIKEEVLAAAIEFCERSEIYTMDITVAVTAGDKTVTVSAPSNTRIVEINHIEIDDEKYFDFEHDEGVITLEDKVSFSENWKINVSLKPLKTVTSLPDILYHDWYQTIAAGAKAKLMIMSEKPWSNANLAVVQADLFEKGVKKAIRKALAKTLPTEKRRKRRSQWL